MKCPSCSFNNMPGTERCARCQAQLTVTASPSIGEFTPPRAGRLKGLRGGDYWYNRLVDKLPTGMPDAFGRFFRGQGTMTGPALAAMFLSVVPGLGHLFSGRRKGAIIAFVVWAAGAVLALTFYYGGTRYVLVSLLAGWHASVALDAGRPLDVARKLQDRMRIALALIVISFVAYFFADQVVANFRTLMPVHFKLEAKDVESGDILTIGAVPIESRRGDIVLIRVRRVDVRVGFERIVRFSGDTLAVVVALAGDTVAVTAKSVKVNGETVPNEELPDRLPRLPAKSLNFVVPEGSVFAVLPLSRPGEVVAGGEAAWRGLYTVAISDIIGKATGIYLPWSRRGAFEEK